MESPAMARQAGAQDSRHCMRSATLVTISLYLALLALMSPEAIALTLNPQESNADTPIGRVHLQHPYVYAVKSFAFPGQSQIELGQAPLGWGIRAVELVLLGSATIYSNISASNYSQAQAALIQSDQDLYYGNALGAYNINQVLLWTAASLWVANVAQAWFEAERRQRFAMINPAPGVLALRMEF